MPDEIKPNKTMPILNYSTSISAEKTVTEIQRILAKAKAEAILCDYNDGVLTSVSFRVRVPFGVMSFRLPANVEKVYAVLVRDRRIPASKRTMEQASRVAWRILKDWLDAQMALIAAEMVSLEQVFLPYAQNQEGVTLYDALAESRFRGLALPPA